MKKVALLSILIILSFAYLTRQGDAYKTRRTKPVVEEYQVVNVPLSQFENNPLLKDGEKLARRRVQQVKQIKLGDVTEVRHEKSFGDSYYVVFDDGKDAYEVKMFLNTRHSNWKILSIDKKTEKEGKKQL